MLYAVIKYLFHSSCVPDSLVFVDVDGIRQESSNGGGWSIVDLRQRQYDNKVHGDINYVQKLYVQQNLHYLFLTLARMNDLDGRF